MALFTAIFSFCVSLDKLISNAGCMNGLNLDTKIEPVWSDKINTVAFATATIRFKEKGGQK